MCVESGQLCGAGFLFVPLNGFQDQTWAIRFEWQALPTKPAHQPDFFFLCNFLMSELLLIPIYTIYWL